MENLMTVANYVVGLLCYNIVSLEDHLILYEEMPIKKYPTSIMPFFESGKQQHGDVQNIDILYKFLMTVNCI
jgi:hypothetical protein